MLRLMRPATPFTTLAALLALAACASPQERLAERGARELIGLPRDRLLSCAGQPVAEGRENGAEILVFHAEMTRRVSTSGETAASPMARPDPGYSYTRSCEATFVLRDARVTAIEMEGKLASGRPDISACGIIMERCLRR